MKLSIFDFDGTITSHDSFIDFIFYSHGPIKSLLGILFLSPVLILYFIKILPNWKTKEIVFSYFFKGWKENNFKKTASKYSTQQLPKILKKNALERIVFHQKSGDKVLICTASFECYLKNWCQNEGCDLIGTKIEFKDGLLTGKFSSKK